MINIKKYKVKVQKELLSKRTEFNSTEIVRKLYNEIPLYNNARKGNVEQYQMFIYMILMTAHRLGELNKLEKKTL